MDWRKVALVGLGLNAAYAAFIGWGATALRRAERERNRVRWSDKNRWE